MRGRTGAETRGGRWAHWLDGALTVVAFSEAGRMRRVRLPHRTLALAGLLVLGLLVGASVAVLQLYGAQVELARLTYLEGENRSLAATLARQAEQLGRLGVELQRLKELERSLRIVSGIDAPAEPSPAPEPGRPRGR